MGEVSAARSLSLSVFRSDRQVTRRHRLFGCRVARPCGREFGVAEARGEVGVRQRVLIIRRRVASPALLMIGTQRDDDIATPEHEKGDAQHGHLPLPIEDALEHGVAQQRVAVIQLKALQRQKERQKEHESRRPLLEPHATVFAARHVHSRRFAHRHEFVETRLLIAILQELHERLKETQRQKLPKEEAKAESVCPRHHHERDKGRKVVMKNPPRLDVRPIHAQDVLAQTERHVVVQQPHLEEQLQKAHVRKEKELKRCSQKEDQIRSRTELLILLLQFQSLFFPVHFHVHLAKKETHKYTSGHWHNIGTRLVQFLVNIS